MRTGVAAAILMLSVVACAGAASAQDSATDMTIEEKFEALKDAGILDQSAGSTTGGEAVTPEQFISIIGQIVGQENDDAPDSELYNGYTEAIAAPGLIPEKGADDESMPNPESIEEKLLALLAQGANGATGGGSSENGNGWAQDNIGAITANGLPAGQNSHASDAQLEEDIADEIVSNGGDPGDIGGGGGSDPGGGTGSGGGNWPGYPFYTAGDRTAVLPDTNAAFLTGGMAVYHGDVRGTDGAGNALAGTSEFNVFFDPGGWGFDGVLDFDSGDSVGLSAYSTGASVGTVDVHGSQFQGGAIDNSSAKATGNLYGPNAEEFAGTWAFTVDGGSASGPASGDFVTKR